MAKRAPGRGAEAPSPEAEEGPSKRRRAVKNSAEGQNVGRGRANAQGRVAAAAAAAAAGAAVEAAAGAATAAAAGAAGRAESDNDGGFSGHGSKGEVSGKSGDGEEGNGQPRWRGVMKMRRQGLRSWRVRLWADAWMLRQPGAAPTSGGKEQGGKSQVDVGLHRSAEAAARVYDLASIAINGLKAAAASLNFPASEYAGEVQRFGPDLASYIEQLSELGKAQPVKERKGGKLEGDALRRSREGLVKAKAARQAKLAPKREAEARAAAVQARRHADPLWTAPKEPCGLCPACRQPWRTDMGGCVRLAAAAAAGHNEAGVVQLLASDAAALRAVYGKQPLPSAEQEGHRDGSPAAAAAAAARQCSPPVQQQRQQSRSLHGGAASRESTPGLPQQELEWLEPPPRLAAAPAVQAMHALRSTAVPIMRQQLALEEAAFLAALEQEQHPAAPAAAVHRMGTGGGAGGGSSRASAAAAAAEPGSDPAAAGEEGTAAGTAAAAAAGEAAEDGVQQQQQEKHQEQPPSQVRGQEVEEQQQELLDASLIDRVDPSSWLSRAAPPRSSLQHHQDALPALARLAGLCREGGLEAPLVPEHASEVLEASEQQQQQEQQWRRRWEQQQQQQRLRSQLAGAGGSSSLGGGSEEAEEGDGEEERGGLLQGLEAAANTDDAEEEGEQRRCQLCGGKAHGRAFERCSVLQMALAVPVQPPVCPACAHQEQPGCQQCLGGSSSKGKRGDSKFERSVARSLPWVRRAPWLDRVPPATRELMLAAQDAASAAVADLDQPGIAWRCTPKALLAVGLLAEEAARLHLKARLPAVGPGSSR